MAFRSLTLGSSSNVAGAEYDPETRALRVRFHSGDAYTYHEVGEDTAQAFAGSASPGGFVKRQLTGLRYTRG